MISSKSRLVVPYGLKTLLEGLSRAILKTNPTNITQFAAVYFKELIVFREGNTCLDIKDLVKQFHQIKVEKWSEGMTQEKPSECVKEAEGTPVVSQEPTRMEKSTYTEEDNMAEPQFSNKTTQFPTDTADRLQPEETPEGVWGPSKPPTPKTTTPPSSPLPAPVSAEVAYVPADPAQFAAQMLGNVPSTHSDDSEVLMVDVATSMPRITKEVLSSEMIEEVQVATPQVFSREAIEVQVYMGPQLKEHKAEPSAASSAPLQGEQEPPAYGDQAPKSPVQADIKVSSIIRTSSVYNDVPVIEGVVYVEQIPEHIVIPFTDQVACLKENEQSPPVSPKPVEHRIHSGISKIPIEEENVQHKSSVHVEAVLLSGTLDGQPEVPTKPLVAEGFTEVGASQSLHLEMEIVTIDPDNTGQEEPGENSAPGETEGQPVPEGFTEPEGEAAPEQV